MSEQKQPRSMLEDICETPSNKEMIERGLLPESCEFNVDTALTFARKVRGAKDSFEASANLDVVIEHLEEIKAKIKKARG